MFLFVLKQVSIARWYWWSGVEGEGSHVLRVSVSFDSQLTSLLDPTQAVGPLNFLIIAT